MDLLGLHRSLILALNLDVLTLWEISFRWHEEDPHKYVDISSIPLYVKDTMRYLAAEVYYEHLYSKLLLGRETSNQIIKKRLFRKDVILNPSVYDFENEFKACIVQNEISPDFLKAVKIPFWELQYWCKEYGIPFPKFWLRSVAMGGQTIAIGDSLYSTPFAELEEGETDNENEDGKNGQLSINNQKAAYARHEPVNQLKRECVHFWLDHSSYSNNQAASKFYEHLPEDKRRLLSPTNASTTLSKAISEYRNRAKLKQAGKSPAWLEGFNPET